MLAQRELDQFAKVCTEIANDVADDSGFVSVRALLERFQAKLLIRPLLVEGMLASLDLDAREQGRTSRWAVLVDSESYSVTDSEVREEHPGKPLPSRLRNTVAHELVHSLAFRPSEFGIKLAKSNESEKSKALVESIERQTERFSPLLLWSEESGIRPSL